MNQVIVLNALLATMSATSTISSADASSSHINIFPQKFALRLQLNMTLRV